MKNWWLTIWMVLSSLFLYAQVDSRTNLVRSYESNNFHEVIQQLLKLENQGLGDFESKILLAQSYYAQRDFGNALKWFRQARAINNLSEKYEKIYAQLLKMQGSYTLSDSIYKKMGSEYAYQLSDALQDIPESDFVLNQLPHLNTSGDELAPTYYRDGLVFLANAIKKGKRYARNNRPWLRLFSTSFKPKGEEKVSVSPFKIPKTQKKHVGTITFTRGDNTAYFSQNLDVYKKSFTPISTLGIFIAKRRSGKWSKPEAFELNNSAYSVAHPTLNKSGTEMYFVSDMPGGYGGTDIYYTKYERGAWSEPQNLGSTINTSGNEMFPFLHEDGVLYFASDGRVGFGGLDIYYSEKVDGEWIEPVNMGSGVNSGYDDFALILDRRKQTGYITSNRPGGKGLDDIYRITSLDYKEEQDLHVRGIVRDSETSEALPDVKVTLNSASNQKQVYSSQHGSFDLDAHLLNGEQAYLIFSKEGYFPVEHTLEEFTQMSRDVHLQRVEINKGIVIPNIYYEFDSVSLNAQARIEVEKLSRILKENPSWIVEIGSHTDSRASDAYNMRLSVDRAENVVQYLVRKGIESNRLFAKGYGENALLNHCIDGVSCSELEHAVNRRTEVKLIGFIEDNGQSQEESTIMFSEEYQTPSELIYKIQLGVFKEPNPTWLSNISDLGNIEVEETNGLYRVLISSYPNYDAANKYIAKVHQRGMQDAFIVAYYQGRAISVSQAKRIEKE